MDLGAFDDAAGAYRAALSVQTDFAEAQAGLGDASAALGRADAALAHYARSLTLKESDRAIAGFVTALVAADVRDAGGDVRAMAIRALATPWARPAELAGACIRLLVDDAGIGACVARAAAAWPSRPPLPELFGSVEADVVFGDELFRTLLESTPVCDVRMERFLTLLRFALLDLATRHGAVASPSAVAFACAVARQCFINDYVYSYTVGEIERAGALRDRLAASLRHSEAPAPLHVAVVAAYFPLLALPQAESLLTCASPDALAALLHAATARAAGRTTIARAHSRADDDR